jgi:spore germination protein YaaH
MYPVAQLSKVVDQIFVMAYDMWEADQQCAGPNSPLPEVKKSLQSYIESGADASALVLGIPWYHLRPISFAIVIQQYSERTGI